VAIRPEHAAIAPEGEVAGTVERVVYLGTDSHVRVQLDSGEPFTLRRQNAAGAAAPAQGERVTIRIAEGSIRILPP
jgi:spermidine/putrescine transport system ATP-binding protein